MNERNLRTVFLALAVLVSFYASHTSASTGRTGIAVTVNISLTIPDRVVPDKSFIQNCVNHNYRMPGVVDGECTAPASLVQTVRHDKNVTVRIAPI